MPNMFCRNLCSMYLKQHPPLTAVPSCLIYLKWHALACNQMCTNRNWILFFFLFQAVIRGGAGRTSCFSSHISLLHFSRWGFSLPLAKRIQVRLSAWWIFNDSPGNYRRGYATGRKAESVSHRFIHAAAKCSRAAGMKCCNADAHVGNEPWLTGTTITWCRTLLLVLGFLSLKKHPETHFEQNKRTTTTTKNPHNYWVKLSLYITSFPNSKSCEIHWRLQFTLQSHDLLSCEM